MLSDTGARFQEGMRTSPIQAGMREITFPLKGIIKAVYYHDAINNPTGQTIVDIDLLAGYPPITKVPLCTSKINVNTGEEWTPDPGDGRADGGLCPDDGAGCRAGVIAGRIEGLQAHQ